MLPSRDRPPIAAEARRSPQETYARLVNSQDLAALDNPLAMSDTEGTDGQPVDSKRKPWDELTCKQKLMMNFTLASACWAPIGATIATVAIGGALALLSSVANDVASVGAQFQVCNLIEMDRVASLQAPSRSRVASAFALSLFSTPSLT